MPTWAHYLPTRSPTWKSIRIYTTIFVIIVVVDHRERRGGGVDGREKKYKQNTATKLQTFGFIVFVRIKQYTHTHRKQPQSILQT